MANVSYIIIFQIAIIINSQNTYLFSVGIIYCIGFVAEQYTTCHYVAEERERSVMLMYALLCALSSVSAVRNSCLFLSLFIFVGFPAPLASMLGTLINQDTCIIALETSLIRYAFAGLACICMFFEVYKL